jgi:hypothetical protein
VKKGLDELEKQFRTLPETRGATYRDDKISNMLGLAQFYLGRSQDAPTPTALVYIDHARQALDQGLEALNRFMSEDLAAFSQAVDRAGWNQARTEMSHACC